jgi:hypothetical protein
VRPNLLVIIANSTVKTVYYLDDPSYKDWDKVRTFLNKANIGTVMVEANGSW